MPELDGILREIRDCRLCEARLPLGPRPVLRASASASILVAGQAPGIRVHASGIPFDDPSGDRLRRWMGVSADTFYDSAQINIIPMGFCYPGRLATGRGDAPPDPVCRATWHDSLFAALPEIRLKLIIGRFAVAYHLGAKASTPLADIIQETRKDPSLFVMPHPSPRNQLWLKRHPWFEAKHVPYLQTRVAEVLADR